MRTLIVAAAISVALSTAPAFAQSTNGVYAACGGPNSTNSACAAALAVYTQSLRQVPLAQRDALLSNLVLNLATFPNANPAVVSQAISSVSANISNPTQANAAVQIAQAVARNEPIQQYTAALVAPQQTREQQLQQLQQFQNLQRNPPEAPPAVFQSSPT